MTNWTINDYEIDGFVTKRDIDTPWFNNDRAIFGKKSLVTNTVRDTKPFRLSIKLRGSDRFDAETSIRAELASPAILIEANNKYIYKNKKTCWVMPTGFSVTDKDNELTCEIAGIVDERTLTNCGFTTGWTGDSIAVSTDTKFGTYSIHDSISTNSYTKYTFPESRDISNATYLNIWHKFDYTYSTSSVLRLYSGATDYYEWTLTPSTSWSHETFTLSDPIASNGSPSLSNVVAVGLYSQGVLSWDLYIGWVYVE